MDLNHHLTQPFRVWLGVWGGQKRSCSSAHKSKALHLDRLSSEALHLEHSPGQGRGGGQKRSCSSAHKKHCTLIACHLKHCTLNIVLGRGGGGTKAFMFLCTQKHCTLIACHLKHCTLNIVLGRGGGGQKRSCSSAHKKHCTLIACHLKQCTLNIVLGRGGGGKSVHVPLHTKALHLDRLSSEALHLEHSLGQARGGQKRSCSCEMSCVSCEMRGVV